MSIESEHKKFDAIFYGSESPMVVFKGPDMVVEMYNKKYHEIYQNRSILGQSLFQAIPELQNSSFQNILKGVYETGESYISREGFAHIVNENTNVLEKRYFDTTFSRISFDDNQTYCILANPREVTERVEVRKKLEDSLRELEEERELRERFVAALSHDLRTPLAIVTMCALILKRKNEDADTIVEMADRITTSVARADRMIRDLLDANRIKAGLGISLSIQECILDESVKHVMDDLKELYGERFEIKKSSDDIHGYWDIMAIHRMIENLVSNAVKYGTPYSTITIEMNCSADDVEIRIHNIGDPLSTEEQLDIFNHYSRSKSAQVSGCTGWGIGLALVKGLAEAHQGSISVHSTKEDGTTFTIKLPRDSRKL